jgi:hypothetical protein
MKYLTIFMKAQVDYEENLDWQRWNQLAKKRILMKVEEPRMKVQQTPQAGYYIRPNQASVGTKVSALTAGSYETDKSTEEMQRGRQEGAESRCTASMDPSTNLTNQGRIESANEYTGDTGDESDKVK